MLSNKLRLGINKASTFELTDNYPVYLMTEPLVDNNAATNAWLLANEEVLTDKTIEPLTDNDGEYLYA